MTCLLYTSDYSISNRAEFEALVKKNLAMQQTDQTKKQQKRIPQITTICGGLNINIGTLNKRTIESMLLSLIHI